MSRAIAVVIVLVAAAAAAAPPCPPSCSPRPLGPAAAARVPRGEIFRSWSNAARQEPPATSALASR